MDPATLSDSPSRGSLVVGLQWGLTIAATITIALRFYVRSYPTFIFGWEDVFIILTWLVSVYECAMIKLAVNAGLGHHLADIPYIDFEPLIKFITISQISAPLAIGFVKVSVIIFTLKLIGKAPKAWWIRWTCYLDLVLFVPVTAASVFVFSFQCVPLSAAWREHYPPGKCLSREDISTIVVVQAAFSVVSDLVTSILPIVLLKNICIEKRLKFWSCGLMGIGFVVTIFAMLRAIMAKSEIDDTDAPWTIIPQIVYCTVEANVGLMAACLPGLGSYVLNGLRSVKRSVVEANSRIKGSIGSCSTENDNNNNTTEQAQTTVGDGEMCHSCDRVKLDGRPDMIVHTLEWSITSVSFDMERNEPPQAVLR